MNGRLKSVFITAGAFVSFNVGAGFASGNELLQFFGSWGDNVVVSLLAGLIVTVIYCVCLYYVGQSVKFEKAIDTYTFFGGKYLGKFFQVFVAILTAATAMLMFSGAGSILKQQFGVPQWMGALILGVLAVVVVIGGLKTVQNVLGGAGIVILLYVLIFGVISIFNPGSSIDQAVGVTQMVNDGKIWQANMFTLFPLSLIPELADLNSPILDGILYGTLCITTGFPFYLSLGQRSKRKGEAFGSAIFSALAFFACVTLVLVLVMMNFNAVIDPATDMMFPFPAVAAVHSIWPAGSWTYVIIIFMGVFTTYTGFLWSINHMFFEKKENSGGSKIFVVVLTIFGILLGSVLPFSQLVNILQPISGIVGVIMIITIVVKTIKIYIERKNNKVSEVSEGV
ncbi:hypothetical protein [Faecalicatena orotica]|uniref:hypothetical protein n=1 Tax=Faecalicatena orotica TaxID=1544 RepID=UPI0032178699